MRALPAILDGCKIFPCSPGTKDPATAHGWKEASNDPAQIEAWQRVNPEFNWAVACGLSGLFVFDIDLAGLDWWAKLLERDAEVRAAVDAAFQVRTPKGGLHVYFRGEGPSTASRIADGIDTRGGIMRNGSIVSGGYVILPGSATKAGPGRVDGSYVELPGGSIADLPECMKRLVPERKKTDTLGLERNPDKDLPRNIKTARDLLTKYVADGRVSIEGKGGNNLAFAVVASILDKGISPGMAFDLLWEMWNPACQPPWDEWELDTLVRNAAAHGEDTDSGAKGHQSNQSAFGAFEGLEYEAPEPLTKRSRFKPMWLHDARKDVKTATWLIPGFITGDGTGILYGLSGSYKTFVALDWALCLAYGVPGQWGAPPVRHSVLFFAGESSYGLQQERVNAWCEKHGQNPDDPTVKFVMVRGVPRLGDTEAWVEVREGLAELNVLPDFIVIDTLTRMMTGMDENSSTDGKLVIEHCEELSRHYGAFVLGIGHTGKDQTRGLRGSQAMIDNSEVVHYVKKSTIGTTLRVDKLKEVDIPSEQFYFKTEKLGGSIVLTRTDQAPGDDGGKKSRYQWSEKDEVVKALSNLGGSASIEVLSQDISGRLGGIDKALVRRTLNKNPELAWLHNGDNWFIPKAEYDL